MRVKPTSQGKEFPVNSAPALEYITSVMLEDCGPGRLDTDLSPINSGLTSATITEQSKAEALNSNLKWFPTTSYTKACLFITFLVFTTACTSTRRFNEFKDNYANKQYSDYYYEEVSRVDSILPQPNDDFLKTVDAKLADFEEKWHKLQPLKNDAQTVVDVDAKHMAGIRELTNDELIAKLKETIQLPELLAIAMLRNPTIKAAETEVKSALERFPQAVNLDSILSQYNAFTRELDTKAGPTNHKQMAGMRHPSPDVLSLKGKVIDQDVFIAMKRLEMAKRDRVAELKTTFFQYDYLGKALTVNNENLKLLEDIIKVAQTMYKSDRAKYANVILAQVELAKLTNAIITLNQKRDTSMAKLNSLMNLPVTTPLGPPDSAATFELVDDSDTIRKHAVNNRQEIQIKASSLKRMELMVSLAGRMTYPDATTGGSYFENRAKPSLTEPGDSFAVNRVVQQRQSANVGQQDAYIREMKAKTSGLNHQLDSLVSQTAFLVNQGLVALDASSRSLKLHHNVLIPQAKQAVNTTKTAYTSGKVGFIAYLDAQRTLLQVQLSDAESYKDYQTVLARLDQLTGTVLKRKPFEKSE